MVDAFGGDGGEGSRNVANNNDEVRRVCHVEAVFATYDIVSQKARYYHIVASVEGEVLSQISDLIVTIPEHNPYSVLKDRFIARYADSGQARLQKLLDQIPLGDKRPSHVLQEMRGLAVA